MHHDASRTGAEGDFWTTAPPYFTTEDVARIGHVTTRTVRRWHAAGLLRASKPAGGRALFRREDVRRFLDGEPLAPLPTR